MHTLYNNVPVGVWPACLSFLMLREMVDQWRFQIVHHHVTHQLCMRSKGMLFRVYVRFIIIFILHWLGKNYWCQNRRVCTKVKGSHLETATFSLGVLAEQRSMALAVQHLDWVMFWSDTDAMDPVWVGCALVCSDSDWKGKCWYHNTSGKTLHSFGSGKITLKL